MGLTDAVKTCLRKPLRFSGRATRTEFWWFLLVLALIYAGIIQALIILDNSKSYYVIKFYYVIQDYLLLVGPTGLAFFLLLLAVAFRRVHDTGRSGCTPMTASVWLHRNKAGHGQCRLRTESRRMER